MQLSDLIPPPKAIREAARKTYQEALKLEAGSEARRVEMSKAVFLLGEAEKLEAFYEPDEPSTDIPSPGTASSP